MQAVILVGGKGTRLRPLTNTVPKPLIDINGKPFLQYQLELIKSFSTDILLLVSYLGEKIEKYFGDGSKLGLKIEYCYEKNPLGTGGALNNTENKLQDEFILFNGDTYLHIDYGKLIEYFHQYKSIGVVVVYDNSEKIAPNNIVIDKSGMVTGCNRKDSKNMSHIHAGIMIFKKNILDFIPKGKICSMEEDVFPKLIKARQLYGFETNQRFYDMGSPKELEAIKDALR